MRSPPTTNTARYSASASPASDLGGDHPPATFGVDDEARASSWAVHAASGAGGKRIAPSAAPVALAVPAVAAALGALAPAPAAPVDAAPADTAAELRRAKMMAMLQAARDGLNL